MVIVLNHKHCHLAYWILFLGGGAMLMLILAMHALFIVGAVLVSWINLTSKPAVVTSSNFLVLIILLPAHLWSLTPGRLTDGFV